MKIVVIGGGASGMMAAIMSARTGEEVILLESNEKLGKKIYITGKGRCNLTNDCTPMEFLPNVVNNNKFLYSAINTFNPQDTIDFFGNLGLVTKTERGNRVFPLSDKASDVTKAMEKELKRLKVDIRLNTKAVSINTMGDKVISVTTIRDIVFCNKVILATGGITYPQTGSTGMGHKMAENLGHKVTKLCPSLTDVITKERYDLAGLTLKNIMLTIEDTNNRVVHSEFGELLFTHTGISGPTVLTTTAYLCRQNVKNYKCFIDFKPALTIEQLDNRILRDFEENNNKHFKNSLDKLLPEKAISVIISLSKIDADKKVNQITAVERKNLVELLKNFPLTIERFGGAEQAIITSGGVAVSEINPKTMQSKRYSNLYFAGELIDVDALTGGYNLQIAFATGYLAGLSATKEN